MSSRAYPQGHEYTSENTYIHRTSPQCRACKRARERGRVRDRSKSALVAKEATA